MTPLGTEIAALIRQSGPIGVDRYMALCLGHPVHGYYRTRDPLGAQGDFITAPEISQMFGELIGAWTAYAHGLMGQPDPLVLVELGPGRGTLMADALRTLRAAAPGVRIAPHCVETSPVLRAAQERALAGTGAVWHDGIETLPPGPAILLANEFFDCLPVRQFERRPAGWHERQVGLGPQGGFVFGLAPEPTPGLDADGPESALMSVPAPSITAIRDRASAIRFRRWPGTAMPTRWLRPAKLTSRTMSISLPSPVPRRASAPKSTGRSIRAISCSPSACSTAPSA